MTSPLYTQTFSVTGGGRKDEPLPTCAIPLTPGKRLDFSSISVSTWTLGDIADTYTSQSGKSIVRHKNSRHDSQP